jgi:hypothetical protein
MRLACWITKTTDIPIICIILLLYCNNGQHECSVTLGDAYIASLVITVVVVDSVVISHLAIEEPTVLLLCDGVIAKRLQIRGTVEDVLFIRMLLNNPDTWSVQSV